MPRIIDAFTQFFDDNGDPLIEGFLKFVESGTNNTDKDTFADIGEAIPNSNPVALDAAGRCPNIFGTGTYNVISYTSSMVQIQQFDPVGGDPAEGAFSAWDAETVYSAGDLVTGSDGNYYRSLVAANQNNNPTTSPSFWEEVAFRQIWNTNVTYGLGDTVYASDGFLYISTAASNLGNNPTTDNTKWRHGTRNGQWAAGGGTADAITATFSPAKGAWDEDVFYVIATGANTITNPTIDVGPSAKTIVMHGNSALAVGSLPAAGFIGAFKYSPSNDNVELLNPKEVVTDGVPNSALAGHPFSAVADVTGTWALIETWTPTAVASKNFTMDESLYDVMKIVLFNVTPATDGAILHARLGHTDGGTIISSTNYDYDSRLAGAATLSGVTNGTEYAICSVGVGTSGTEGLGGEITTIGLSSIRAARGIRSEIGYVNSGGAGFFEEVFGMCDASLGTVFDTVQLLWSAGNFGATGMIYVYGLKKV